MTGYQRLKYTLSKNTNEFAEHDVCISFDEETLDNGENFTPIDDLISPIYEDGNEYERWVFEMAMDMEEEMTKKGNRSNLGMMFEGTEDMNGIESETLNAKHQSSEREESNPSCCKLDIQSPETINMITSDREWPRSHTYSHQNREERHSFQSLTRKYERKQRNMSHRRHTNERESKLKYMPFHSCRQIDCKCIKDNYVHLTWQQMSLGMYNQQLSMKVHENHKIRCTNCVFRL